jgi:hypothetical protein
MSEGEDFAEAIAQVSDDEEDDEEEKNKKRKVGCHPPPLFVLKANMPIPSRGLYPKRAPARRPSLLQGGQRRARKSSKMTMTSEGAVLTPNLRVFISFS